MNKCSNIEGYRYINGSHHVNFSKSTGIRFALATRPTGSTPNDIHDLCMEMIKTNKDVSVIFTTKTEILTYIDITINALKMEKHQLDYDLQVLKGLNRPWEESDEPIKEGVAYAIEQVNLAAKAIWYQFIGKIDEKEKEIEEKQKQRNNLEKIKEIIEKE